MRALAAAMLVVGAALLAAADDHPPSPRDEATVPVPPTEHQRVQYLRPAPLPPPPRHRDHQRHGVHLRPLGKRFVDRDAFVAPSVRRTTRRPRAFPTSCSCAPAGCTSSPSQSTHRYPFGFFSSGRPEGAVPRERA